MDTRRRSDNRERSGTSPSTDPQPADDDVGSETKVVRLSDGQPYQRRTGGLPPTIIIGFVAVAVLAFSLGANFRSMSSSPSPTPAQAGLASPSAATGATSSPDSTPRPTQTIRPSFTPTPQPTAPPKWAWARHDLLPTDSISIDDTGAWGVGDRILVLTRRVLDNGMNAGGLSMARLAPGRDWDIVPVSQAIEALYAGTVIDGRLWFVARVGGVNDATWQLVSTTDGSAFDSLGPTVGLGPLDGVNLLGRVGGRWVVAAWNYLDASQDATASTLRSSEDGVLWEDATVPDGALSYRTGASNGKVAIVLAGGEGPGAAVLRTDDGQTWERTSFSVPMLDPTVATCWSSGCAVSGYMYETNAPPVAWVSADGRAWNASNSLTSKGIAYHGITMLVPYDGGILAMSNDQQWAFLSKDGLVWRAVAVLPAQPDEASDPTDIRDALWNVAIAGDNVIALVFPNGNAKPAYYRGSFAALLAAP